MDEKSFLSVVAHCLAKSPGSGGALERSSYEPSSAPCREEITERLVREVEKVGGSVHRVSSLADARKHILSVLHKKGARRVVRGNTTLIRNLDLHQELDEAGVEVTVCDLRSDATPSGLRESEFSADCGITSADYGVAETGTLALLATPGQGRAISLLPPLHIAVLKASDVVYELSVLFERARKEHGELPSALTFITGPSRTADIELVLTVGVHGPKELHLVLVDT